MDPIKAICAGTLYTPTEKIPNAVVLIEGHHIVKVGTKDQVQIPQGAAMIDDSDRIVVFDKN